MNRFPRHYHEGRPLALSCAKCDQKLSEAEEDAYWVANPVGQKDPVCDSCREPDPEKTATIRLPLTAMARKSAYVKAARQRGMSLAQWVFEVCDKEAGK